MKAIAENSELKTLFATVVKGGYCIGCGACASLSGSPVSMQLDQYGLMQATLGRAVPKPDGNPYLAVCPFSNQSLNEDELGAALYSSAGKKDEHLGYVIQNYAGYVAEGDYRA
ncbi:hypothetical protein, partial [Pedobacter sp.]|uniref:hypothetical protein n=1 Tax=Pedobacter sp. TaxID=1411316 RepID=UPI003D7F6A9B